jgi:hypothetical protein
MNRLDFIRRIIKFVLLLLLAVIAFALGNKVVTGKDCSECPGNGICNGKTDCEKY